MTFIRKDDLFEISNIPKGKSYQWVAETVLGESKPVAGIFAQMQAGGWKPVPAKRHPHLPRDGQGRIVLNGQVLMERSVALTEAAKSEERKRARSLLPDPTSPLNACSSTYGPLPPAGNRLADFRPTKDPHHCVFDVTIGMILTDSELEMAGILKLAPDEYARRKFLMSPLEESERRRAIWVRDGKRNSWMEIKQCLSK